MGIYAAGCDQLHIRKQGRERVTNLRLETKQRLEGKEEIVKLQQCTLTKVGCQ